MLGGPGMGAPGLMLPGGALKATNAGGAGPSKLSGA